MPVGPANAERPAPADRSPGGQLPPPPPRPPREAGEQKAGEAERRRKGRRRRGGGEREPPAPSGRPNAPGSGQRAATAARNRRRPRCRPRPSGAGPAPQAKAPPLRRCRSHSPWRPWRVRGGGGPVYPRGRARRRVAMGTRPPPSRPGLGVCVLPGPGGGGARSVRKRPEEAPRGHRGAVMSPSRTLGPRCTESDAGDFPPETKAEVL